MKMNSVPRVVTVLLLSALSFFLLYLVWYLLIHDATAIGPTIISFTALCLVIVTTSVIIRVPIPSRRAVTALVPLPLTLVVMYCACYFAVMRGDLQYLFVFKHALSSGPDYAPSIIVGLTIITFLIIWFLSGIASGIIWFVKRERRVATREA
jgi:hypothetical protein